ncbi:hypothetical protein EJ08DRAFT_729900 [Tothia fuscella]|uniref:Uncharacterized protein n=1 Tax=Tothia fuscella TaxID=1048955 RepID=A0A9P4P245_9PEZI|nr:hypothetical protein EJ08DRAFT_729900 [Tothia fuscella]
MAPVVVTPKRNSQRRPGRPKVRASEPPQKKLRYIPGGPGGGGRYVDDEGNETPVGGTGPGGYAFTGPRRSTTRHNSNLRSPNALRSPSATISRPRRERDRPAPQPRYSSAAAAATAMTQSEGYKPREERSWEEFHNDLDIEVDFIIYSAEEVDGPVRDSNPVTPYHGLALQNRRSLSENGAVSLVDEALLAQQTPPGHLDFSHHDHDMITVGGPPISPAKRRPGRPPKQSMLSGLGSPPAPRIIPLPTHNPKERLNLPKPNYRKVETFLAYEQSKDVGVNFVDKSLANVGYQESDRFFRPVETYIRGGEGSIEEELDFASMRNEETGAAVSRFIGRVEYDMDEQDERWLEGINAERLAEGVEAIRPAIFEITMTQIEKEWHALEKRIPKPNPKPPQTHRPRAGSAAAVNGEAQAGGEEQDSKCAICDDGDCENTNAIVFCDGCDLAVHQECYGVPFIPEGQWMCRKCQLIGRNTPTCIFCPNVDGAFKQSNTLRWAHLLCAIWVPEVSLGNQTFMEPVMDVEKVPKQRWKLTCYLCQQKMGACVQCSNKNCYQAFHVTCARRAQLFLRMKNQHGGINDASALKAFCHRHVPSDWRKEHNTERATADAMDYYRRTMKGRRWADSQTAALALPGPQQPGFIDIADEAEQEDALAAATGTKRKREKMQKKIWRLPSGAPVVPNAVYLNVEASLARFSVRQRKDFVAEACKYWTLKREARRGAALLKRLQLQMETFTSMELTRRNFAGMGAAGRPRLRRRIEFAEMLENEMDKLQKICKLIKEREAIMLQDAATLKSLVHMVYFPIVPLLTPILEKAASIDENNKNYFKDGLAAVWAKLEQHVYVSVLPFTADLAKVFRDAMEFDPFETSAKLTSEQKEVKMRANRIISKIKPALQDAARKEAELGLKANLEEDAAMVGTIFQDCFRPDASTANQFTDELEELEEEHSTDSALELPNGIRTSPRKSPGHSAAASHAEDVEMTDIPEPSAPVQKRRSPRAGESTATTVADAKNGVTDTAIIRLQVGPGQTIPISNLGDDGSLPALSNSGSTNPSTTNADPLTPPRSEKDLLAPLAQGGVPWYFKEFNPEGTTVYDEQWQGREVLRGMTEELSEIDDDALNDLVDKETQNVVSAGPVSHQTLEVASAQKARSRPKRKRPR